MSYLNQYIEIGNQYFQNIKKEEEIKRWVSDQKERKEMEESIIDLKNEIRDNWGIFSSESMNQVFHNLRILEEKIIDLKIQDCEDFIQKINLDEFGNDPDGFMGFKYESELKYLKSLKE